MIGWERTVDKLLAGRRMRLLHYWWPLALGWSLTVVMQRATGRQANPSRHGALLCGIVAAYSLDRVIDPSETGLGAGHGWAGCWP